MKVNFCELQYRRAERQMRETFMWALPVLLWVCGKVWSTAPSVLTPFINSNYKGPQLVKMQHPHHREGEIRERREVFSTQEFCFIKEADCVWSLFPPSHAHCLSWYFRLWSALVWMVVSHLVFWFLSLPLQFSHIAGQISPCLRKTTNHYMPQTLRWFHEVTTMPSSLSNCSNAITALEGQLLTRCSDWCCTAVVTQVPQPL